VSKGQRYLIINADDFGLSAGTNAGIIRCHEQGILTSASLMVRWPAARDAAEYARGNCKLSVGLHVELAEWIYKNGEWMPRYEVVKTSDAKAVKAEVARQLEAFRDLVGRNPSHIDSHQHVHRDEPVRSIVLEVAREIGVPLRSFDPIVQHCGAFYGQTGEGEPYPEGITTTSLVNIFDSLPEGVTEMGCHPGADEELDSVYRLERQQEMRVLCDPEMRSAAKSRGITLCSFADLPLKGAKP
jgi:chitin disaccharide deacetylase